MTTCPPIRTGEPGATSIRLGRGLQPPSRAQLVLDGLVEGLLIALLAFLALAFGGVTPSGHIALLAAAAAMALCLALRCLLAPRAEVVWNWTLVPALAFVGLVALQQASLPAGLVELIAPSTARTWSEALSVQESAGVLSSSMPLSLYPHATRTDLRLILAGVVILFVVQNVFRRSEQVRRLLLALVGIGAAVGLIALAQNLTGAGAVYWSYEARGPIRGGPFVHGGHFSLFMNLTMGAAIALWLSRAARRRPGEELRLGSWRTAAGLDRLLGTFLILGAVLIAFSLSRNGLLSMVVAGAATAFALRSRRFMGSAGVPVASALAMGLPVLLAVGFDPIQERLSVLAQPAAALAPRLEILRDISSMVADHPLLGTGQGSFEVSFPGYDQSARFGTLAHAENQYAELLAETGLVGFALIGLLALGTYRAWRRCLRRDHGPVMPAAYGLGFGLVAVVVHATTDFGLRIPAVGVTAMVFVGLLFARRPRGRAASARTRGLCSLACLAAGVLLINTLPAANAARRAEDHAQIAAWESETLSAPEYRGSPELFERITRQADAAAQLQPDDVDHRYWSALHRWHRDRARILDDASSSESAVLGDVRAPALVAAARAARSELLEITTLAPTYGPAWSVAGQLGTLWLDDPTNGSWIHRGRELAPHHPETNLASALQHLREGDEEGAVRDFKHALAVGAWHRPVIDELVHELGRPDLAHEVARDDLTRLIWLETRLAGRDGCAAIAAQVREEARTRLERAVLQPDASAEEFSTLASYCAESGRPRDAAQHYRSLLIREPSSPSRYSLAALLVNLGEIDEARHQLHDLLDTNPGHAAGEALLSKLAASGEIPTSTPLAYPAQ